MKSLKKEYGLLTLSIALVGVALMATMASAQSITSCGPIVGVTVGTASGTRELSCVPARGDQQTCTNVNCFPSELGGCQAAAASQTPVTIPTQGENPASFLDMPMTTVPFVSARRECVLVTFSGETMCRGHCRIRALLDGEEMLPEPARFESENTTPRSHSTQFLGRRPVSPGSHTVQIQWRIGRGQTPDTVNTFFNIDDTTLTVFQADDE